MNDVNPHSEGTLGAFLHDRQIPGVPCGCDERDGGRSS